MFGIETGQLDQRRALIAICSSWRWLGCVDRHWPETSPPVLAWLLPDHSPASPLPGHAGVLRGFRAFDVKYQERAPSRFWCWGCWWRPRRDRPQGSLSSRVCDQRVSRKGSPTPPESRKVNVGTRQSRQKSAAGRAVAKPSSASARSLRPSVAGARSVDGMLPTGREINTFTGPGTVDVLSAMAGCCESRPAPRRGRLAGSDARALLAPGVRGRRRPALLRARRC